MQTLGVAWQRMMITASDVQPVARTVESAGVSHALHIIESGFLRAADAGSQTYAVPSAGAIYPYEFFVVTTEDDGPGVFHVDPARRRCHRLDAGTRSAGVSAAAGITVPPRGGALVAIVLRPWLSMRKYGDRGYLYAHLDAAHAGVNLLGVANQFHQSGVLRLGVRRSGLAELLGLTGRCREVHSVLAVAPGAPVPAVTSPASAMAPRGWSGGDWSVRDLRTGHGSGIRDGDPSWLERACWGSLAPLLPDHDHRCGSAAGASPLIAVRTDLPLGTPFVHRTRWSHLSQLRTSSKGFRPGAITGDALWRTMSASRVRLVTDLPAETGLQVSIVVRAVDGLRSGVFRLTGRADEPTADRSAAVTGRSAADDVVRACMNQEHVRHACAFALIHGRRRHLVGGQPSGMRDMVFRAGALGHLLYLGAVDSGVGVTGIGGFDSERWRTLAGLPKDHDLLYVLAFGSSTGASLQDREIKWDRLQRAYA